MNWPKIKTALICLFLAIDIFLAGWDIALRRGKSRVSDEVVENTVSLLADRTISAKFSARAISRTGTGSISRAKRSSFRTTALL